VNILMLGREDTDMDAVDALFNYIPEMPDENYIELANVMLLPTVGDAASTVRMENNNNEENHPHNDNAYGEKDATYSSANTNENIINEFTVVDEKKDDSDKVLQVKNLLKAKRGRPHSKPPSMEVVKKRRKVG
jgi:hypothetical protein